MPPGNINYFSSFSLLFTKPERPINLRGSIKVGKCNSIVLSIGYTRKLNTESYLRVKVPIHPSQRIVVSIDMESLVSIDVNKAK